MFKFLELCSLNKERFTEALQIITMAANTGNVYQFTGILTPVMSFDTESNATMIPLLNIPEFGVGGNGYGRNSNKIRINSLSIQFLSYISNHQDVSQPPPRLNASVILIKINDGPPPKLSDVYDCTSKITPADVRLQANPFGTLQPAITNTVRMYNATVNASETPTMIIDTVSGLNVGYALNSASGDPPNQNQLYLAVYDTNVGSQLPGSSPIVSNSYVSYLVQIAFTSIQS